MAKMIEVTTSGGEPLMQALPLSTEDGELRSVAKLRAAVASVLTGDGDTFSLRYTDSDGDEVTIARDADVKELADYMADEQLERVTVLVVPAAERRVLQTQLRGLVTAMSKLTTGKPKMPTPANAMNLLVASLQTMDVAEDSDELAAVKKQLLNVLEDEEFKKAVEELSALEEFKDLVETMAAAIYVEDAQTIEETVTARFDELLMFAQRLVAHYPALKPAMINVAKNCVGGLLRFNDEELAEDGPASSSCSSISKDDIHSFGAHEVPVHVGVICDGCKKAPLTGVRYKAVEMPDFDLCDDCEASGKWVSYEPFIKITDPSRAPKQRRTPELLVHPFVVCDGCEMRPIVGPRFKSKTADDFDLCETCEASGKWSESHGPFTKIQEPGMMHALKFTCRRGGKSAHRSKFGSHHGKFGGHHGHFGRHGHHGPPGIPFYGPPPHQPGHDFCGFGPRPLHKGPGFPVDGAPLAPPRTPDFGKHGRPGFPGHQGRGFPPPPADFGKPEFYGHHGDGITPPPPQFDRGCQHGPPEFGPRSFGRFGTPPFGYPGPHGPPPCPPDFPMEFGRRGHHGRHGRPMNFQEDDGEQQPRHGCRGRGRWGRDTSDLEARFLEDVTIEDGTIVEAGKPLRKMWKLVNDGKRPWPEGCYMITQPGNPMLPDGTMSSRIDLPALGSGEEFIAGVDLVTPTEPGRYTSFWRVCDPTNVSFGHRFWIDVVVAGDDTQELTTSETPTVHSGMKDAAEVVIPADALSDVDIEIIEAAEAQEVDAAGDVAEVVDGTNEDSYNRNKVVFKESLKVLAAMGFIDSDKNLRALELADGNVGGAINVLLSE